MHKQLGEISCKPSHYPQQWRIKRIMVWNMAWKVGLYRSSSVSHISDSFSHPQLPCTSWQDALLAIGPCERKSGRLHQGWEGGPWVAYIGVVIWGLYRNDGKRNGNGCNGV